MRYIEHLIEPDRLLLSWQAQESKNRSRYVVGELVRKNGNITLNYFKDSKDFADARQHGFSGHPAFQIRENVDIYDDQVLEAFTRRIPPRSRSDFYRYMELRGLNPDHEISDFALLGYVGARLPDDGFELVHPFDTAKGPFEFITEIAGFRHESKVSVEDIALNSSVEFNPEPDNSFDPNAIRIELNGTKLGYVDRGRLDLFHRHLKAGHSVKGEIARKNGTPERPLIYIYTKVTPATH
ncbi:HIRAN domain-containing protein [Endozoicomonas elysicola]|uniref:HIRAN domain-containing protein n=1 Tax=Endozoicomonas elysicola TaxID=305900 RepID=A0A081K7W9_9GAMM|nr:HIRAN domain-containing protein [Endozoicomonas elysicola]KEI70245.1 hypothetical protein GV64_05370 [Endozoicomonas elysicola]